MPSPLHALLPAESTTPQEHHGIVDNAWFEGQRLRFIEARLFWSGRINRSDLIEQFGIHRSIASSDLTRYQALAPANLQYDTRAKTYLTTASFQPVFDAPTSARLLGHALLADRIPNAESPFTPLPSVARASKAHILRNLIVAIHAHHSVRIRYRSMRDPDGMLRTIEPRQIIFDGHRWHARAFCHHADGFRDFVIGRIDRIDHLAPATQTERPDTDWQQIITIEIAPHPALSDAHRALVAHDCQMRKQRLRVPIRAALARYLLIHLGLDDDRGPPRQVLSLTDPDLRDRLFPTQRR